MSAAGYSPRRCLAVAVACCALACGSGSSGGGIDGTGFVVGPITGFGSIVVNGIAFDVETAAITIEDVPATESDLRLGMVVTVRGTIADDRTTGTAETVEFEHVLQGPVSAVDVGASTFVAVGQTIVVDADTVFDGTTLDTLLPGDIVEVSGLVDAPGALRATRIELQDDGELIELTGFVSGLDDSGMTFLVGAELVDFSTAQIVNAPSGGLADGLLVDVSTSLPLDDDVLVAELVEVRSDDIEEGTELDVDGIVTSLLSATEFVLSGTQRVRITEATDFDDGTADDLAVGVRVEVEGVIGSDGFLIAEEIEFDSED